MIKQFVEDGRYDCIETGSLIWLRDNVRNIAVSSEAGRIKTHPMDFKEFPQAVGDEGSMASIRDAFARKQSLGRRTHECLMNSFGIYMMVGSMLQAVNAYIRNRDMNTVEEARRKSSGFTRRRQTKSRRGQHQLQKRPGGRSGHAIEA